MSEYNTDYKFNPRVREIIEAKRGKMGLTHAQAEILIKDIFSDKYKGDYKFSDEDKKKILFYLTDFDPNSCDKEDLVVFSNFLLKAFTQDEIVIFVTKLTDEYYNPGKVMFNVRVFNAMITYFISLFPDYFKMYKGIIINKKFIGDVKKVYPEVVFNEDTGEITDELVDDKLMVFVLFLKSLYGEKLKTTIKDDIFVLVSDDELVIKELGNHNLSVEDVPEFYFSWE